MDALNARHRALHLMRQYRHEMLVGVLVYFALVFRDLMSMVMR